MCPFRRAFHTFQPAVRWCKQYYTHTCFESVSVYDNLKRSEAWSDRSGVLIKYTNHAVGSQRRTPKKDVGTAVVAVPNERVA